MFNQEQQIESDINSPYDFDNSTSNVDIIESVETEVRTVGEVKKIKSRQVNLATVAATLKGITKEELAEAKPIVVKQVYIEATRIYNDYKSILDSND